MSFIYLPFSYVMKACVWISMNSYLFGLFFFALAFELILLPLAFKQQKSQIAMAKIRPKEMAIRKKYAGRTDRVTQQKMQMEINEMHQQEGYNPLSGCLPLLIQLPLVLILFSIVRGPILYSSSFTSEAQSHIKKTVEEVYSPEKFAEKGFEDYMGQYAFDYLEEIRENLNKDDDDTKAANESLLEVESLFGIEYTYAAEDTDKKTPKTYENGLGICVLTTNDTNRQIGIADVLANYGEDFVNELKEKGALDKEFKTSFPLYVETKTEKQYFADMIPDFTFFGLNLLDTPSFESETLAEWLLLLIPLLVFLTSFLSHKVTMRYQLPQTGPDGQPHKPGLFMTVGMPMLSAVFALMMPAAIGCYWVWRTLLSMIKTPIVNKFCPIPRMTEEELEEAVRELNAKSKGKKKKVITIEVDEDDDSYADLEVSSPATRVETARPKVGGSKQSDLPYRQPTTIEMLSADDDDEPTEQE
ncbi:MAG: membrane protein insertase YidC [Clostridia bacterium]|nr:membrane protein insertase YidC [Clostridia bacterium]